jgi:hypothetical protein
LDDEQRAQPGVVGAAVEAGAVIDRDMHAPPPDCPVFDSRRVGAAWVPAACAGHTMPSPPLDATYFLDVDMDQLPRPLSLVSQLGLETQSSELAILIRVRIPETVQPRAAAPRPEQYAARGAARKADLPGPLLS